MKDSNHHVPKIQISKEALSQIKLIKENDYTVEGLHFRISIDGKGCNGFDYALGFHQKNDDDTVITMEDDQGRKTNQLIHLDPLVSFYIKEGHIDYIFDHENQVDGFVFENKDEKKYRGKFFKDESKTPKHL